MKSVIKDIILKTIFWNLSRDQQSKFFCEILNYYFLDWINESRFLNYRFFYFAIFGWWVDRYWGRGVGNFTQFGKFNLCSIRLRKSGWFNQVSPIAQNELTGWIPWAEFRGADFFPMEIFPKLNIYSDSVKNSENSDDKFIIFLDWFPGNAIL